MIDLYTIELERAIYNWYYGGDDADPEAVFHALAHGVIHDMQVLVPETLPEQFPYIPVYTDEKEWKKGTGEAVSEQLFRIAAEKALSSAEYSGIVLNQWDKKFILSKNLLKRIMVFRPKSHITFVKGSVVEIHAGAIVNAANTSLLGGGGVDGAIHQAAGPELLEECRTLNGCRTGEAKITNAYHMTWTDHIIHTVGPVYSKMEKDVELLGSCYRKSLDLAHEYGCMSIAFPCISTGVYGYPVKQAAKIALLAVSMWMNEHPDVVMEVYFCCFRKEEMDAYMELLGRKY